MTDLFKLRNSIEPLEARIAPAAVLPTIKQAEAAYDANPIGDKHFVKAQHGDAILLSAGQVLTTGSSARDGTYLLFVEKGEMFVFLTDLNNNNEVDFNEVTGIAAGNGLRFTSFVDIHGDIVTNYDADKTLSDAPNGPVNDIFLKGDGRILNNSRIEAITLRSLTVNDLSDQNADGFVDATDVSLRLALSSYSIHGQILAGAGFGVVGDSTSGLLIDTTGNADQLAKFNGAGATYYIPSTPTIGAIRVGTAASGEYFSFGISRADNIQGSLSTFTVTKGAAGGDIYNIRSANKASFSISGLYASNGGIGGRGGNIDTVTLSDDKASGYQIIAGNGGSGPTGGMGGSILGFTDLGSTTGQVLLDVGDGGTGITGAGGNGGTLGLGTIPVVTTPGTTTPAGAQAAPLTNINVNAGFTINLGNGGSGFTSGGNGANLVKAVITTPEGAVEFGRTVVTTSRDPLHDFHDGKIIRDGEILSTTAATVLANNKVVPAYGILRVDGTILDLGPNHPVLVDPENPGIVGRTFAVDIDQDGFTDVVFTTGAPEQLVVQFGNGTGGFRINSTTGQPARLYLDGPAGAEALAVGDFNGDGHQDIAVASSDVGNYAGITVFLAKWEDTDLNGTVSEPENILTATDTVVAGETIRKNDFLGFYTGRTSPLPSLQSGDPAGAAILNGKYGYVRSANAITDLVTGDFDGDGFTEIAVAATYLTFTVNSAGNLSPVQHQIVMVLTADQEVGEDGTTRQTGQFYADVGTRGTGVPSVGANPFVPFYDLGPSNGARLEATAFATAPTTFATLGNAPTFDVIAGTTVAGTNNVGNTANTQIVTGMEILNFSFDSIYGPVRSFVSTGSVDTNRELGKVASVGAFVDDFTVVDFDQDGTADFVALAGGFMVAIKGDGLGFGTVVTTNPGSADNRGFFFGTDGFGIGTSEVAIRSTELPRTGVVFNGYIVDDFDLTRPGVQDDVAVLNFSSGKLGPGTRSNYTITEFSIWDFSTITPGTIFNNPGVDNFASLASGTVTPSNANANVVAFDTFVPDSKPLDLGGQVARINYATANPDTALGGKHVVESLGDYGVAVTPLTEHFVKINGGNGGNGTIGRGGAGGYLGGSLAELDLAVGATVSPTLFGSLDVTLPLNIAYSGEVRLTGGKGGHGFTTGGNGGGVFGTNVHFVTTTNTTTTSFHTGVFLTGGEGGFGISGAGGSGGSLIANSLESGVLLTAGNGGRGKIGGNGGSVIGHGNTQFPDLQEAYQVIYAGTGGNGVTKGGDGGSIRNYHGLFDVFSQGNVLGVLNYVAGDGGTAVSGPGGNGGDISNVSPFIFKNGVNRLSGDVYLRGGEGGNGLTGGRGGDVSGFANKASEQDAPAVLSILGGSGGDGTRGRGGRGGNVTDIVTSSKGAPNEGTAPQEDGKPVNGSTRATVFSYNRIIAGDGGKSSGNIGGAGGQVAKINVGNTGTAFAVISGNGGYGLLAGGNGGSVIGARVDVGGGSQGKTLVIAGAGGDAGAFIANPLDTSSSNQAEKAFGGKVGVGGDGGSIRDYVQVGGIGARADLIAGNGGDTVFYGRVGDTKTFVGKGGSIVNISVDGNLGNISPTTPIKSYNDLKAGESIAQFVASNLRNRLAAGEIGDDVGNVGVIVGAAGRLKSVFAGFDSQNRPIFQSLPAFQGVSGSGNGDLINVSARSIMSAVAGSVERTAGIRLASNVKVIASGEIGTDKAGDVNYLDKNGFAKAEPVTDGSLVDGAMVLIKAPVNSSIIGNIFVLPS